MLLCTCGVGTALLPSKHALVHLLGALPSSLVARSHALVCWCGMMVRFDILLVWYMMVRFDVLYGNGMAVRFDMLYIWKKQGFSRVRSNLTGRVGSGQLTRPDPRFFLGMLT